MTIWLSVRRVDNYSTAPLLVINVSNPHVAYPKQIVMGDIKHTTRKTLRSEVNARNKYSTQNSNRWLQFHQKYTFPQNEISNCAELDDFCLYIL